MCFSLAWFIQLIVWLAVLCVIFAIIRLWLPHLMSMIGVASEPLTQTIRIILGLVIFIAAIWLIYDIVMCAGVPGLRGIR